MERKLMAFVMLLVLVGSVCGCSQQEAETDQVELQQEAVTDSATDSEAEEITSDAADAQGTVEDVQAESSLAEPLESEVRLPDGISQEEWDLVMEEKLLDSCYGYGRH